MGREKYRRLGGGVEDRCNLDSGHIHRPQAGGGVTVGNFKINV